MTILSHEYIIALSYDNVTKCHNQNIAAEAYDPERAKMTVASPLESELKLFEKRRLEWAHSHPGKFVVIQDGDVLNFFDQYEEAYRAAVKRFGLERNFLIKQVWKDEPVYFVA